MKMFKTIIILAFAFTVLSTRLRNKGDDSRSFSKACTVSKVDDNGANLSAKCKDKDNKDVETTANLGALILNNDGKLEANSKGGFQESASACGVKDGVLTCKVTKADKKTVVDNAQLNLNDLLAPNDKGVLTLKGQKWCQGSVAVNNDKKEITFTKKCKNAQGATNDYSINLAKYLSVKDGQFEFKKDGKGELAAAFATVTEVKYDKGTLKAKIAGKEASIELKGKFKVKDGALVADQ